MGTYDGVQIFSYDELVSDMFNNMSDEDFDNQLKLFNRIARKLKVKVENLCIVGDVEFTYSPVNLNFSYFNVTDKINSINSEVTYYEVSASEEDEDIKLVYENFNGVCWLYFSSEDEWNRYRQLIDSILYDDSID